MQTTLFLSKAKVGGWEKETILKLLYIKFPNFQGDTFRRLLYPTARVKP